MQTSWPPDTPPRLSIETRAPRDKSSPARVVKWIPFDSSFRGTELRVGDHIVGHDNIIYAPDTNRARAGESSFDRFLSDTGRRAGDTFSLLVDRGGPTETVAAALDGPRRPYRNADGKQIMGPDGPVNHAKDGFDYSWWSWYSRFVDLAQTVLAGWEYTSGYNTKRLREQVQAYNDRVDFLQEKYPSAIASATRDDYDAMVEMLAGEPRTLTPADLSYRSLGAERAKTVAAAADQAFATFLNDVSNSLLEDPPVAPNPFREDIRPLIGRRVRLPVMKSNNVLAETRRTWYWSGRSGAGYLVDRQSEALRPMWAARDEYIEKVDPFLRYQNVELIGRIEEKPALVADPHRNITVAGLQVRPEAAMVFDARESKHRFFVDLRTDRTANEAFAGEARLDASIKRQSLTPDASPQRVMEIAFASLKNGDMDTWRACYADWKIREFYEGADVYQYVDLTWNTMSNIDAPRVWDEARRRLLDDVYAVQVSAISAPQFAYRLVDQPEENARIAPEPKVVEEVTAEVDHVGRVGDEFRTFAGFRLHRRWRLQRLDNGPWRITDNWGI